MSEIALDATTRTGLEQLLERDTPQILDELVTQTATVGWAQGWELPPAEFVRMIGTSLVGILRGVLLLGTMGPLGEEARWLASLLRNRGVATPWANVEHLLAVFAVVFTERAEPALRPAARLLMDEVRACFAEAFREQP